MMIMPSTKQSQVELSNDAWEPRTDGRTETEKKPVVEGNAGRHGNHRLSNPLVNLRAIQCLQCIITKYIREIWHGPTLKIYARAICLHAVEARWTRREQGSIVLSLSSSSSHPVSLLAELDALLTADDVTWRLLTDWVLYNLTAYYRVQAICEFVLWNSQLVERLALSLAYELNKIRYDQKTMYVFKFLTFVWTWRR